MIRVFILILFLFNNEIILSQLNPQSKKVTNTFFQELEYIQDITPALKKKKGFTNYEELIDFLNKFSEKYPDKVKVKYIGKSQKGKRIPILYLNHKTKVKNKVRVWLQGGLHGDEPASTESLLYTIHKLLEDENYTHFTEKLDLAILPMANIDGFLKNKRYAANGLDLNLDHTKLMAVETQVIKRAFADFDAHVALDFHEYRPYRKDFAQLSNFGITALYDAMFLNSGNLNVPKNLRLLTQSLFIENAEQVLDENNFNHHPYISTKKYSGDIHFNQGSTNARSSATNFALTNTISTLFEIRGVGIGKTAFKRRVYITYLMALSYMETSFNNIELIKDEIRKATDQTNAVVVTSLKSIYKDSIQAIDLDTNAVIDLEVTIRDGLKAKPNIVRDRPKAYLIDYNETLLIEKLKTLGVEIETLMHDQDYFVETYTVSEYKRATKKYEKMNLQTIKTENSSQNIQFPKGTFKISMQQRRSNIVAEVLEPEAPNSFVSFGVLKTEKNQRLPIYRISN